jgi:hypothetical protein
MTPDNFDRFADRRALFGPSPADRLLANAASTRIDLHRFIDDEGKPTVCCTYKLVGSIDVKPDVDTGELLLGIVRALGAERREGGGGE